jgi:hypothetical protein
MLSTPPSFFTSAAPAARYPPLALWMVLPPHRPSAPPSLRALASVQRPVLMVPLNEVVDEHYSIYYCRLRESEPVPAFCG